MSLHQQLRDTAADLQGASEQARRRVPEKQGTPGKP